ncbi:hypothetical protein QQZ08_007281 [Neonectria magnoliae]|uniref:SnoaL-like domain-containing protein n=1 Tax=Neonectria magnoliae TaxID=2732573 RepID=A0ABR1HYR0_9HYPO
MSSFNPSKKTEDLALRNAFFSEYVVPDVKWTIAGRAHSLVGTWHSLWEHNEASFNHLEKRLVAPIKFVVTRVVVDGERAEDGWWACVEVLDEATRRTGLDNNENVWLTRFNDQGKIVEVRSYFDTILSEQVLAEPVEE